MAFETKTSAGTIVSDSSDGSVDWVIPGASSLAENEGGGSGATTYFLVFRNWSFAIPGGATIDGYSASLNRSSVNELATDEAIHLVIGDAIQTGVNKSDAAAWPAVAATKTWGGAADKWSAAPSVAQINASGWGFVVMARFPGGMDEDSIYAISAEMTVYYTAGGGGGVVIPVLMNQYRQRWK